MLTFVCTQERHLSRTFPVMADNETVFHKDTMARRGNRRDEDSNICIETVEHRTSVVQKDCHIRISVMIVVDSINGILSNLKTVLSMGKDIPVAVLSLRVEDVLRHRPHRRTIVDVIVVIRTVRHNDIGR